MSYEKEKKYDHLFTEWENKFITNLNKDKEINKTENPNKEILGNVSKKETRLSN